MADAGAVCELRASERGLDGSVGPDGDPSGASAGETPRALPSPPASYKRQVERFTYLQTEPETVTVLCQRIAEGETMRSIAQAWQVPPGALQAWAMADRDRWQQVLAAKQAWVQGLVEQIVAIADGEGGEVARDRLRIEARWKVAGAFSPELFGRESQGSSKTQVNVVVNRSGGETV